MNWEWDRGRTGRGPSVPDDAAGLDGLHQLMDYATTREQEDAELERLRNDPAVLVMVSKRIKKSIGRTADIPIVCGQSDERRSLAFGIVDGVVELVMIFHPHPSDPEGTIVQFRMTGEQTSNVPMQFSCKCDSRPSKPALGTNPHIVRGHRRMELAAARKGSRRTRLWLYKAALAALASDTRKRPTVQLHT